MARKTTGKITTRSKKAEVTIEPAIVETASPATQTIKEARKPAGAPAANPVPVNLEEAIRRRAYELYLERRATAGAENGDQNQDWLIAEREVRSRDGGQEQHSA